MAPESGLPGWASPTSPTPPPRACLSGHMVWCPFALTPGHFVSSLCPLRGVHRAEALGGIVSIKTVSSPCQESKLFLLLWTDMSPRAGLWALHRAGERGDSAHRALNSSGCLPSCPCPSACSCALLAVPAGCPLEAQGGCSLAAPAWWCGEQVWLGLKGRHLLGIGGRVQDDLFLSRIISPSWGS